MQKTPLLKTLLRSLLLALSLCLFAPMVQAQTEAQGSHDGAEPQLEIALRPVSSAAKAHSTTDHATTHSPVAKPRALAPTDRLMVKINHRLAKAQPRASQQDPLAGLLIGFGLALLLPSLAAIILGFIFIVDPFFLPMLIALVITCGIVGVVGLILLIAGLITLATQKAEAESDTIQAEEIK